MTEYRLDNWENPYYMEDGSHLLPGEDRYCFQAFEAGADTIVRAQKKSGVVIRRYQNPVTQVVEWRDCVGNIFPIASPFLGNSKTATVVVIPDKEVKDE